MYQSTGFYWIDFLNQAATYRELQQVLKSARAAGYKFICALNAKKEVLEAARNALVKQINADNEELFADIERMLKKKRAK